MSKEQNHRWKQMVAGVAAAAILANPFSVIARGLDLLNDQTQIEMDQSAEESTLLLEQSSDKSEEIQKLEELSGVTIEQMQQDFQNAGKGTDSQQETDDMSMVQSSVYVDGVSLLSAEAQAAPYVFLSSIDCDPESTAWSGPNKIDLTGIKKDTNPGGGVISLLVNGKAQKFLKGVGAHAPSNLIYDISQYSAQYPILDAYVGVDAGRNGNGSIKIIVYGSNDKSDWTVLQQTGVLTSADEAVHIRQDVSQYTYIRLVADENGGNGNDHAVYGDLRLMTAEYDPATEGYTGVKTLEEYDKQIAQYGN